MRRAAIGLAAALALASAATIAIHEHARDAWQSERAQLGTEAYDAARSDAAWDRTRAWRTTAERVAIAGALALLLAAAFAPASASASASASTLAPARAPVLVSTLVDTTTTATALVAARALPSEGALGDALGWWLPALALAAHAALLARGATLGMRVARIRIAPPSFARTLFATVATPLFVLALPALLTAWLTGRRSTPWLAPQLAVGGIRI